MTMAQKSNCPSFNLPTHFAKPLLNKQHGLLLEQVKLPLSEKISELKRFKEMGNV